MKDKLYDIKAVDKSGQCLAARALSDSLEACKEKM